MALFKVKLRELKNANVQFLSLVDRAATRMPFRVLKRDTKETEMGINLTKIFKGDTAPAVTVTDVIVFAQADADRAESVRQCLDDAGLLTDTVLKGDDETTIYRQTSVGDNVVLVRLSDQMLVRATGLAEPKGFMADVIEEQGFYPGTRMATAAMYEAVEKAVKSGEAESIAAITTSYTEYMAALATLPTEVYKADAAIEGVVTLPAEHVVVEKAVHGKDCDCTECKDAVAKDEQIVEDSVEKTEEDTNNDDAAEAVVEDTTEETVMKADNADVLEAISKLTELVAKTAEGHAELAQKVETAVQTQIAQASAIDALVKKNDDVAQKLTTTVVAGAPPADRVAEVKKQEDSPSSMSNWDSAYTRRRR